MLESGPKPLIAVIDDDIALTRSLAALLCGDGFRVELFGSAEAFLADAAGRCHGCLLIDWMLPGMTGIALCRHMAARRDCPPLILMSAASPDIETLRSQLAVEIDFLAKPFEPEQLLARLSQLCVRRARPAGPLH